MKKKYEKPIIAFENMELNTTIAACAYQEAEPPGSGIESNIIPGAVLFTLGDGNTSCDVSGDSEDIYCHHNPNDLAMEILTSS